MRHLIESGLYLLVIHAVYVMIFSKSTWFEIRRVYLVFMPILALAIPLLPQFETLVPSFVVWLDPITISAQGLKLIQVATLENNMHIGIAGVFWFGAMLIFLRWVLGLYTVFVWYKKSIKRRIGENTVCHVPDLNHPCSFFKWIFISDDIHDSHEKECIILHESLHGKLFHSFDKLFMQVSSIFFWWHPSIYLMGKNLNLVHEYQVDREVVQQTGVKPYLHVLLKFNNLPTLHIANNFSSHLKNRINMIYNPLISERNRALKLVLSLATALLLISIHACRKSSVDIVSTDNENMSESSYVVTAVDTIVTFDMETKEESMQIVKSELIVEKMPDVLPLFPGCDAETDVEKQQQCSSQKMMEFISMHLKYPETAKNNGMEGMNVITFVVNTDGYVFDEKIVKSLSPELDQASLDIIDVMRAQNIKFTPGMHKGEKANVQLTLPIRYKLHD